MISGTIPRSWQEYAKPFPAAKYHVGSVWLLADAELEGKLWNEYFLGGFLGYWLAPGAREFVNGSLNLPREALAAQVALQRGQGLSPDEGFLALLDRYEVDLFFGIGLPQLPRPNRPWLYSTGHLERAPGWIPVFRDLHGAVSLRTHARNRANLARIAAHYAREGVPFDELRGFDAAAVIRAAPAWALAHGLVPGDFASLEADASEGDPARKRWALDRLASIWLALGAYDESIAIDRRLLRSNPGADAPSRRLVWALLRQDRVEEAREAARGLARARTGDLSAAIAAAARRAEAGDDPDARIALLARLPVFTRAEASQVAAGVDVRPTRSWRE
jgi:tetratricopeptide (TPR) repeat protein